MKPKNKGWKLLSVLTSNKNTAHSLLTLLVCSSAQDLSEVVEYAYNRLMLTNPRKRDNRYTKTVNKEYNIITQNILYLNFGLY